MKPEKTPKSIILISKTHLWDGYRQLPGILSLTPKDLIFEFDDFHGSHLNLIIPLVEIETVEHFLVFETAKNGLKVTSKKGSDLFLLEEPMKYREELMKMIENL